MPRATWGVSSREMDKFDRDKQFKPYTGPTPPLGVYQWKVKNLKHLPATGEKNAQLRIGLELVPRNKDERKFKGYFLMEFAPVASNTQFRYVPFLDAIGVSTREFETRTITDAEGNIKKIGRWANDGEQLILAKIKEELDQNKQLRRAFDWFGPVEEEEEEAYDEDDEGEFDEEEYEDDEEYDEDEEDEEYE